MDKEDKEWNKIYGILKGKSVDDLWTISLLRGLIPNERLTKDDLIELIIVNKDYENEEEPE